MPNIICIDPGHGGKDPGGGSNKQFLEKDMVLKISKEQAKHFKRNGITPVLTRTSDEYLDSYARTLRVRRSGAHYCISNHINAGGGEGAETIYSIYSSHTIAEGILNALVDLGAENRRFFCKEGNSGDYYYMHRMTGSVNTVIVEYGFADNEEDTSKILKDWKEYAEAVAQYYIEHVFNKEYIPEEGDLTVSQAQKLQKQINALKGKLNGKVDKPENTNTPHKWAKENWEEATTAGYFDGTKPLEHITRQEVAVVINRLRKVFTKLIEENTEAIEDIEEQLCKIEKQIK